MDKRRSNIRSAMEAQNLSYRDLEKLTGISASVIQRYVSGETNKMSIDYLESIAKALHVSAPWLLGWEEVKKNNDALSDIIIRAQKDEDFFAALVSLHNLPADKLAAVKVVIDTLGQ